MVDPSLPQSLSKNWFWARTGTIQGPLELAVLLELIRSWEIDQDTLVWHPSIRDWERAGSVPALSDFLDNQGPPPLPPRSDRGSHDRTPQHTGGHDVASSSFDDRSLTPTLTPVDALAEPKDFVAGGMHVQHEPGLVSARRARASLITMMVIGIASVLATSEQLILLSQLAAGIRVDVQSLEAADGRAALVGLVWFIGYLVTAVLFIRWLRQAYDLAHRMAPDELHYSKGWTIWGWLIPIAHLFVPYRLVKDIWRIVTPGEESRKWMSALRWWWGMWLVFIILSQMSLRHLDADSVSELLTMSWLSMLASVAAIVAAAIGARIVTDLTRAAMNAEEAPARTA